MRQSRLMSLVEAVANVIVGYGVAVLTQMLVFPLFGLRTTLRGEPDDRRDLHGRLARAELCAAPRVRGDTQLIANLRDQPRMLKHLVAVVAVALFALAACNKPPSSRRNLPADPVADDSGLDEV